MIRDIERLEIPNSNPFKNDRFGREAIADNLEKIIRRSNGSLVISVDASWGMGKTTFIQMWKKKLSNSNRYQTLYFNAWENDDTNDPLVPIMASMEEELELVDNDGIEKVKEVGIQLVKKSLPSALKILTRGILDIEKIKLGDYNEEKLVELAGEIGSIELKNHKNQKQAKSKFKQELKDYRKLLKKKVIFFIDELDKCRPAYVIETLERIKHLFDIEGYIFILSLDKQQLIQCIKMFYGNEVDSSAFLRRFIDLEYSLPEPDRDSYLEFLVNKFELKNQNTEDFFIPYLKGFVKVYNLSLRDINKLIYYLNIVLPMSDLFALSQSWKVVDLQVFGIIYSLFPVLKTKSNDKYQQFINKNFDSDFVSEIITFNPEETFKDIRFSRFNQLFIDIVSKLLKLNKDSDISSEDYWIRLESRPDSEFNLIWLLDDKSKKLRFINDFEFADRFQLDK